MLELTPMATQAIWLAGICLEALLVFRIWRAGNVRAYPLFFSYVVFVLVQEILSWFVAHVYPSFYPGLYWSTEAIGLFAGCALVLEFHWIALAQFPGVAKLARIVLMSAFWLTGARVLLAVTVGSPGWSTLFIVELERDMRFVQSIAILALLLLFLIYRVPIGRNLRGIILGYGLFLGINIVNLTYLERFGGTVRFIASGIQSFAYFFALCVWIVFLWSYSPQPSAGRPPSNRGYRHIFGRIGG